MTILLIRHGQTNWNLASRLQGREDIPLNDIGRTQAKSCAQYLTDQTWHAIYTSPLSRAQETAEIISNETNHPPVIVEPLLTEREFGKCSGMTWKELKTRYPLYPNEPVEEIEPFPELCQRMDQALHTCITKSIGKNIILVSHGGSINALLHFLSKGTIGTGITYLKNTCISRLDFDPIKNHLLLCEYNLSGEEYAYARKNR